MCLYLLLFVGASHDWFLSFALMMLRIFVFLSKLRFSGGEYAWNASFESFGFFRLFVWFCLFGLFV